MKRTDTMNLPIKFCWRFECAATQSGKAEYYQFGRVGRYLVEVVIDCTYFSYSNRDFSSFTPASSIF